MHYGKNAKLLLSRVLITLCFARDHYVFQSIYSCVVFVPDMSGDLEGVN
jgi:hypothetical protein